ncbi:unnamed protein product [Kuraishia capsulata CBS 1993]|uniref:Sister chromatid cohesion protein n=1 Tax=Kuraishia capsulata CBS 1993 TaxID=1382522 RepID=W6MFJ4_9ASCO|nr:uncharacterized protein KUCA_T00000555001 [Kuraishia capsulata CBS 1993]CDK24589.1 unnamed protein product [Kuraishia capsulata CBS 1993]
MAPDGVTTELVSAISSAPLSYLIPRQDAVPLAAPARVSIPPFEVPGYGRNEALKLMEDATFMEEVLSFVNSNIPELQSLQFKKPAFSITHAYPSAPSNASIPPQLEEFRHKLEEKVGRILRGQHIKPDFKVKRVALASAAEVDAGRETESAVSSIPESPIKRPIDELQKEHKRRKIEYQGSKEAEPKDAFKSTEGNQKAKIELVNLLQRIGLTDNEVDFGDRTCWKPLVEDDDCESSETCYMLSNQAMTLIQSCLLRLRNSRQMLELETQYLLRIQKCIRLTLEPMTEKTWTHMNKNNTLVFLAKHVCAACLTYFSLLKSGSSEKQLNLSPLMETIVDTIYSIVDDGVRPFYATETETSAPLELVLSICSVINELSDYIRENTMDESIITRLEYLTIKVLFFNVPNKRVSSGWDIAKLRLSFSELLSAIFSSAESQRSYIIEELCLNFDKTPSTSSAARSFKTSRGLCVSVFTMLTVNLVTESFSPQTFDFNEDFWSIFHSQDANIDNSKKQALQSTLDRFELFIDEQTTKRDETVSNLTSSLLSKIVTDSEITTRKIFEIFVEDLLAMMEFPEWPAAETILFFLTKGLVYMATSEEHNAVIEAFALEMIGLIGCKIVELKKLGLKAMTLEGFQTVTGSYFQSLFFLQDHSPRAYQYLSLNMLSLVRMAQTNRSEVSPDQISSIYEIYLNSRSEKCLRIDQLEVIDLKEEDPHQNVMAAGQLVTLYEKFLSLMLSSLNHPRIKARTRAIKNLALLTNIQPAIILLPGVKEAVELRIKDESSLVRDAVVDFMSSYCKANSGTSLSFTPLLCQLMSDDSVAVRKRVIKTCNELYMLTDQTILKTMISQHFLLRKDDEETSIRKLAVEILLEHWVNPLVKCEEEGNDPTLIASDIMKVILPVLDQSDEAYALVHRFFVEDILHKGEKPQKYYDSILNMCNHLIGTASNWVSFEVPSEEPSPETKRSMLFLSMIASCDGMLISQDLLVSLQCFLEASGCMFSYSLDIFRDVLVVNRNLKPDFARTCESVLLQRLTKLDNRELAETVRCIWLFSNITGDSRRIASAAISCIRLIKPFADSAMSGLSVIYDGKLMRLLSLIGHFGSFCQFDQPGTKDIFISAKLGLKTNDTVRSLLVRILLCFSGPKVDRSVRSRAIENLLNICTSDPILFKTMAIKNILSVSLNESSELERPTKKVIINAFTRLLQHAEKETLKRVGLNINVSGSSKIDITAFHGESNNFLVDAICTSLVQDHLQPILGACLQDETDYAFTATKLLSLIIRLGLANPRICIATVIALESSSNAGTREIALAIHQELYEKHESLIETSYTEGFRLAVSYRKRVSSRFYVEFTFLHSFFGVFKNNVTSRRKALSTLGRSFCFNEVRFSTQNAALEYLDYISYISRCFNAITCNTLEEAYTVVKAITVAVCSPGYDILSKLETSPTTKSYLFVLRAYLVLLRLNHSFMVRYGLNLDTIGDFSAAKGDRSLRVPPKARNLHTNIDLHDLDIECLKIDNDKTNMELQTKLSFLLSSTREGDLYD